MKQGSQTITRKAAAPRQITEPLPAVECSPWCEDGNAHAGTAIRAIRTAQELSLRQLGALARVDHSTLSKVERGLSEPSAGWLRAVTDALGRHLGGVI